MNEAEAGALATTLADALSETLASCLSPEPEYAVQLVMEESGVVQPGAKRVLAHFRRLLASTYQAPRPNSFQSQLVPQLPLAISLSGGVRPVVLRLWTEAREGRPWLGYELTGEGGVAFALGGFHV